MPIRAAVIDTETVPDLDAARRLLRMDGATDQEVRAKLTDYCRRGEEADADVFVRMILQKLACVAVVEVTRATMDVDDPWLVERIVSAHTGKVAEKSLIKAVEGVLSNGRPLVIGWNSSGFDMPLLRFRAMANEMVVPSLAFRYGDGTPAWKYPEPRPRDYWKRYGDDQIDLCDLLSGYGACAKPKQAEVAALLGVPAKIGGFDGGAVEGAILEGKHDEVAFYCETDVVSLFLIWLRYEVMRGALSPSAYDASVLSLMKAMEGRAHLDDYRVLHPKVAPGVAA